MTYRMLQYGAVSLSLGRGSPNFRSHVTYRSVCSNRRHLLAAEDAGNTVGRNVGYVVPKDTATPLWEPEIWQYFLVLQKYCYICKNTKIYPYNKYIYIHIYKLAYKHWDISIELMSVWLLTHYVTSTWSLRIDLSLFTQCELNYCQAGRNGA
jgi:hypothetical protein